GVAAGEPRDPADREPGEPAAHGTPHQAKQAVPDESRRENIRLVESGIQDKNEECLHQTRETAGREPRLGPDERRPAGHDARPFDSTAVAEGRPLTAVACGSVPGAR